MGGKAVLQASDSHPDLGRAPYALYGVKYIDLVSPALFPGHGIKPENETWRPAGACYLDLMRASYVVYGIKYVDLVSLCPHVLPTLT